MTDNKNNDLRWQRTEGVIQRAFIELLRQDSFTKLTVSALIKRAGISRAAFYLHYQDKYQLLEKYRQIILNKFQHTLQVSFAHFEPADTQEKMKQQFFDVFKFMLDTLYSDFTLVRTLFKQDKEFKDNLEQLVNREIAQRMKLMHVHYTTKIPRRYAQAILAGQLLLLLEVWVDNPHPESPDKLARILTYSRVTPPLGVLEKDDS